MRRSQRQAVTAFYILITHPFSPHKPPKTALSLSLFVGLISVCTYTLSYPHYPSKFANTLASLVKGEVLSPEKIRATTGGIVTPPTFPKPHYPLLCTITLASLVKGRWIDGKAQVLILLLSACDIPTIFMLQTFCRQDGGIAQQTLSPHNLPKPHYPYRFS